MKRVFLCDDHQIVLDGLTASLGGAGLEVAGAFLTSRELLERLTETKVDLVVIDLNLADMDGVTLARHLKKTWPALAVMALTHRSDTPTVRGLLSTGAEGYVLKTDTTPQILESIQRILRGQKVVSADLTGNLIEVLQAETEDEVPTRDEDEVLRLVCAGLLNKQIAASLGVSMSTVERRRASLMRKAGARSTAELILWANRTGRLFAG